MRMTSKKQYLKNAKGITLLALVITIIVLIILAGVTISALLGDDGIVKQADIAEERTNQEGEIEQIQMAYNAELMNNKTNNKKPVTVDQLRDRLNANGAKINSVSETDNGFEIEFKSGRKYSIDVANKDVTYEGEDTADSSKYFTFTVDENTKTATITGIKEEYAEYSYYQDPFGKFWNEYSIKCVINDNGNYITDIVIPSEYTYENNTYTVTAIGERAFGASDLNWMDAYQKKEKMLKSVTIPNTVTTIGDYAFAGHQEIEQINIPDSVTSIGNYAFYYCTSLTSITIPNGVTSIGNSAFYYCTSLTSITIPNGVTSIGNRAFSDCSNLTSITIANSVTSIGEWAFGNCKSINNIFIPLNVTNIGECAFGNWTENQTINCQATSKPTNWNERWDYIRYNSDSADKKVIVKWGVSN